MAIGAYLIAGNVSREIQIHTYTWQIKKGNLPQTQATINGTPKQLIKRTKGRGQGTDMEFCAYFSVADRVVDGKPEYTNYFFWTTDLFKDGLLPADAQIFTGDYKEVQVREEKRKAEEAAAAEAAAAEAAAAEAAAKAAEAGSAWQPTDVQGPPAPVKAKRRAPRAKKVAA